MDIPQAEYDRLAALVHSDTSPVGIDAKKTHIMLLYLINQLHERIDQLEQKVVSLQDTKQA